MTSAPYSSDAIFPTRNSTPIYVTSSPAPTASASTSQPRLRSRLTIGSIVGIALTTGAVTIFLSVLVSSLYIKRYKRQTVLEPGEHADLIVCEYGSSIPRRFTEHIPDCMALCLSLFRIHSRNSQTTGVVSQHRDTVFRYILRGAPVSG